jgi:hypothetical protein
MEAPAYRGSEFTGISGISTATIDNPRCHPSAALGFRAGWRLRRLRPNLSAAAASKAARRSRTGPATEAGDARAGVDKGDAAPMRLAERPRQPVQRRGRRNETRVIGPLGGECRASVRRRQAQQETPLREQRWARRSR